MFDHRYFFNLLLPPIILKSGYDLDVSRFFNNIGTISLFAFVGTFISAMIIGVLLFFIVLTPIGGVSMSFVQCLMFGSILSSTDPVTVLSIFNQVKVDPDLYALIFGESMLNDAVSIVLYHVLDGMQGQPLTSAAIWSGFMRFFTVFIGSTVVGVVISIAIALILKHTQLYKYPALESSIVILSAYLAYILSNTLDLTGIVSLLFCGMTMKHYVLINLSPPSQKVIMYIFHVISHLAETFIFIYLGVSMFTQSDKVFRWGLIIFTFIFILLARALAVVPLARLINYIARRFPNIWYRSSSTLSMSQVGEPIPESWQIMLWWSGLRGAIAFALSMDINSESLNEVKTTTLIVVILSILILGGTTPAVIQRLNIELVNDDANDRPDSPQAFRGINWFLEIDRNYLIPFIARKPVFDRHRPSMSDQEELRSPLFQLD